MDCTYASMLQVHDKSPWESRSPGSVVWAYMQADSPRFQTRMVSSKLLYSNSHRYATVGSGIYLKSEFLDHPHASALFYVVE